MSVDDVVRMEEHSLLDYLEKKQRLIQMGVRSLCKRKMETGINY